jgi:hypothetical protein
MALEFLSESGRIWTPNPSASEAELELLRNSVNFSIPEEYLSFLKINNGGFGELDAEPLLFDLFSIKWAVEFNKNWHSENNFLDFWFFGSNGGLESIVLDLRHEQNQPVVMIDVIAGEESAQQIASSMAEFILLIGR